LLDVVIITALAFSIPAIGFDRSDAFHGLFKNLTSEAMLGILTVAGVARLCLRILDSWPRPRANLVETFVPHAAATPFGSEYSCTVIGFCYSLGWNFFFYRLCYDLLPMFKSMRVVSRGAMIAYLGLALLAGVGVNHLRNFCPREFRGCARALSIQIACVLLLAELNAAPLRIMRGEPYPDAVTMETKKDADARRIVELPDRGDLNYAYMLRVADLSEARDRGHSGFNSPIEDQIER